MEWLRRTWSRLTHGEYPQASVPASPAGHAGNFREVRRLRPFAVLAKGDVFYFHVYVTLIFHAEGLTREQLKDLATVHQQSLHRRLKHQITDVSRRYPPHQAVKLEDECRAQFSQARLIDDGVLVRWQVKLRILPEQRVREKMRPYWERLIEMDSDHELSMRRAELVDNLTRRWSEVLEQLHRKPFTVEGAKLAEQEFSKIMGDLRKEEKDLLEKLHTLLQEAGRSHSSLGLYEYAETYDKLVKEYQQQYDLHSASRTSHATHNGQAS